MGMSLFYKETVAASPILQESTKASHDQLPDIPLRRDT